MIGRIGAGLALIVVVALTSSCRLSQDKAKLEGIPESPTDVELRFVDKGLQVSWKPSPRATSYHVFWGKEEGVYDRVIDCNAESVVLSDLQRATFYTLAVTARNAWGESEYSEEKAVIYDDDPKKSPEFLAKAKEMMVKGYHQEALAYLSAVIRLDPDNPDPYRFRAALNEKLGRRRLVNEDLALIEEISKRKAGSQATSPSGPGMPSGINEGIGPK